MSKLQWKPTTILYPLPVVMVSSMSAAGVPNIITVAWAGTINSDKPMLSISIKKERYSHELIKSSGEFVVNLTTEALARATDYCGVKSGRDTDKFAAMNLTPVPATQVKAPLIKESPLNIECVTKQIIPLGSHDMFLAEVVAVNVDEELINKAGKLCLSQAKLICYSHGEYWSLKKSLGFFGYSVAKRKINRR